MKKVAAILISAAMLLGIFGCGAVSDDTVSFSDTEAISDNPIGITMEAKDVTPTGMTLVCTQSGGNPTGSVETGSEYHIERFFDGEWKDAEYSERFQLIDFAWTLEAWLIPNGGSVEFPVDWSLFYDALPQGRYRIVKSFMDFRGPGDYDTYECSAEFEITE